MILPAFHTGNDRSRLAALLTTFFAARCIAFKADCEFDHNKNIVIETFTGDVDYDKLITITKALHRHPEYFPDMNAVLDLSDATLLLNFDEMEEFVHWLGAQENRIRGYCAFITKSALTYGGTRMYLGIGEDLQKNTQYFDSIKEAVAWIEDMCRKDNA